MIMNTKEERTAAVAARQLVGALRRIEKFTGDPEMILDEANVVAVRDGKGVVGALKALRAHYLGEEG